MEETVARGVIDIEARDEGALASLRRLDAEFDRTMHRLDGQEAEVRIKGNLSDLRRSLKEAEAEVKAHNAKIEALEQRRNDAVGAKKGALTREINQRKEIVRELNNEIAGSKRLEASATKHYDSLRRTNEERSIAAGRERAIEQAVNRKAAAEQKYITMEQRAAADRFRDIQSEARRRATLQRQRDQEYQRAEAAAHMMNVNRDRERVQILQLQREYAKLTDRAEYLGKKNVFSREGKAKLNLDTAEVYAKMELVKATLNRMGAHPPVDIKVDLDRRGLQRVTGFFADVGRKIGDFAGNIPNMAVRLGPFTTSIKGLVAVMGILGPTLVDVAGAATALVGVLGTGLTGATFIASGTMAGLLLNLAGVKEALNPMIGDFKIATQTTLAYHKAVLKYGKGSEQAKTAQEQMNNALKGMDPRARAAATGIAKLGSNWQKLTREQANSSFLHVMEQATKTMSTLQPTLARNTNRTFQILDERLTAMLTHLRSPAAIKIFDSLGRSANNFLNPVLDGFQHLGALMGRIAESAARLFAGRAGNAFKNWARDLDAAYPAGKKLDAMVTRLGNHARDLGRFFVSLGRLLATVLNGGADAGDGLLNSMTKTMDKWTEFLRSTEGNRKMGDFFDRAADGAKTLYHTFGPLIAEFVKWASYLSPFVTGFLKGANAVGKVIGKIVQLTHLGGSVSTFAATLGAIWAVGRMGSFLAMIARVITAIKTLGAVTSATSIVTGSFGAKAAAAGVAIRGSAVAAERTAAARGVGAAEGAASGIILPPGVSRGVGEAERVAAKGAGTFARLRGAVGGATMAMTGLSPVALGATIAVGGLAYGIYKLATRSHESEIAMKDYRGAIQSYNAAIKVTPDTMTNAAQANLGYKQAVQSVAQAHRDAEQAQSRVNALQRAGKTGTNAYKQAVLQNTTAQQNYKQTLIDEYNQQQQLTDANKKAKDAAQALMDQSRHRLAAAQKVVDANKDESGTVKQLTDDYSKGYHKAGQSLEDYLKMRLKEGGLSSGSRKDIEQYIAALETLDKEQKNVSRGMQLWQLSQINAARATQGLVPMANSAASAVHNLIGELGKAKVTKLAVKFPDPKQAAGVMNSLNAAINAGAPKNKAFKVAANSADAEQAIRRLNAMKVQAKILKIRVDEGDALIAIARVRGVKLSPKIQKLLHEGDTNVIQAVRKVLGIKLPAKTLIMLGNMLDAKHKAETVAAIKFGDKIAKFLGSNETGSAFAAAMTVGMRWASQVFKATFGAKHSGASGGPVGFASGGQGAASDNGPNLQATIARAERQARVSERSQGKFNRPTLLVGEENRSEYVIATNPAYRAANVQYLGAAANDLGFVIEPAAKGKKRSKGAKRPGDRKLPPKLRDYVGDVDLSDLSTDVDNAREKYQNYKQHRDSVISANKSRKAGHKKRVPNASTERKLLKRYQAMNRYLKRAQGEKKSFEDLETRIDTLLTAMEEADKSPSGKAEFEGSLMTFNELRNKRRELISNRTGRLRNAVNDVGAKNAPGTKWLAALRRALGQSRLDAIDNDASLSTPEQAAADAAKQAADDLAQRNRDDLSTYGILGGDADLQRRLANLAVAQMDNAPDDPTTIYVDEAQESARNDAAPAQAVADFWRDTVSRLQADPNADPAKLAAAASSYRGAMDDVRSINDTISGVGSAATTVAAQGAILSTARQDLYANYGSNFSPVWTQPGNPRAASPQPYPGAYGSNPAGTGAGGTGSTVINQTNHFDAPPPDPHTWSQGVAWELQAAV